MRRILLHTILLAIVSCVAPAADFQITAIRGNGEMTWEDTNTNGTYTVQWCPSLSETNWSSDWSSLRQIAATGGTITVSIPMFFRVLHRPQTSVSNSLCLVSGGGQPQGPQYDFYMAKYAVTTDEYAAFLNNAEANPGNERGANLFFDDTGNVFTREGGPRVFYITDGRLTYNPASAIGTRYAVYPDYLGHPVTGVSRIGALKYCNWLTIHAGRGVSQRCYAEGSNADDWHPVHLTLAQWEDGFTDSERLQWVQNHQGFRLPMDDNGGTTANYYNEYFKAAAWDGSGNRTYGFGRDTIDGQDANYIWSNDPYEGFAIRTTPAGWYDGSNQSGFQTRANANLYGIFDLCGNVAEIMNDYNNPVQGQYRTRGGSYIDDTSAVDVNDTDYINSGEDQYSGFRVMTTFP